MSLYLGTNCISAGGSSAFRNTNIGEIIQSTIPLTDAGLHLLDGSVISGNGAYSAFVTHIAGLVSGHSELFTTEANWQTSVTNYGVCGKFVYDSVNNTVRLPKITGFVEGTTDVTALGDLIEAGLPNITGAIVNAPPRGINNNYGESWTGASGALYADKSVCSITYNDGASGTSADTNTTLRFDASRSSSIYGNSDTVQPQSIKVLYYIVIATSTKTDIQVDIDEVMTDLNGKVDIADLATCHVVVETYVNGSSWYRVYDDGWCEQGGMTNIIADYGTATVVLLKSFSNTNYTITKATMMPSTGDDGQWNDETCIRYATRTTNSFQIYNRGATDGGRYVSWRACGYIR